MAKRTVTFGGQTFEIDDSKRNDVIKDIANNGYYDYSKTAKERASMTDAQVEALGQALAVNASKRKESIGLRPDDTAYAQYIQAIKELTDENGKVNYDPDGYKFNPYTNGRPDETAQKAFDSLSYKDQLMLAIGKNGKPDTPDFGDPNVDTSVYDKYQAALAQVEADEKAAAEEAKIKTQQEADENAIKAVEDLYRNNRGNYAYDPTRDVKAIKQNNKDVTLTQTELKEIFEDLQTQYDFDDAAYNAWANPTTTVTTEPTVAVVQEGSKTKLEARKEKREEARAARREARLGKPAVGVDASPAEATDPYDAQKAYDAYWAAKDAGASDDDAWKAAYSSVYTEEELAAAEKARDDYMRIKAVNPFMKTFAKLTGKDTIEHYARANRKGSFENDAKYMINQAVQGIGDVVGGVATAVGLATKAGIDAALAPVWIAENEGERWTMEEARERFGALDTIMAIADTSGSGKYNVYNTAGKEEASEFAQYIGGLARSFTSSMTSGTAGRVLGEAFPKLTKTVDLAASLGDKAPAAVKTLAKLVPAVDIGINQIPFLTQSFAGGYNEATAMGYDEAGALVWGGWMALAEGIPESISWNWSSATGSSLKSQAHGALNPDAAKAATKKGLMNLISQIGESGAARVLASLNAEGMSEVMTNYLEWFGRKAVLNQDVDAPTLRQNLETYATGALLSAITQGFSYATTSAARRQAQAVVDGMVNGIAPTAAQVQALDDANNEEAAKQPLTNEQLDNAPVVDAKILENYRAVNNEAAAAERASTEALQRLQQMNANGVPFGSPERVEAVKAFTDARKAFASATEKRRAAHAKYIDALDGVIASTEAVAAEAEAAEQQTQDEYAQWQISEQMAADPKGLLTVVNEMQQAVSEELALAKASLKTDGMRMDSGARLDLMTQVKSLEESAVKLQQMADAAYAAIAPTIAEQPTSEDDGANAPPENGAPVQPISPDMEEQAQGYVATMRQYGATTEEIIRSVEEQAAAEEADETDAAFAEAVKAIVSTNTPSLAQTLIANNASTASEKTITDLLNRARQEGTDEAGIALARELLVNSGAVDNSAEEIKTELRAMNIAPTAEERANIAATYGSYDAYRRAVAGVVPLGGVGKRGSVSIDQAIGALQQDFPGQVTGDDRAAWLYDFAQNNPKGRIYYDGDLDADSAQLWSEIRQDNADFFGSSEQAAFATPDFAAKATRVNKTAAAEWVNSTISSGTTTDQIREYAARRRNTELNAKGRLFWNNVMEATQKPGTQDFRMNDDELLAHDTIHLFTGTSPYTQGNGLQMQTEPSTYRANRKMSALKNELQQIIGFTFNDEYYSRAARRRGAIAYYEPAHNFVSTSDTNNMTALLHEAGHAVNLEHIDPNEVSTFLQTMPATFISQYDPRVRPAEASAEMFRAWMMNPTSMEQNYPNTFNGLRQQMGARRYGQLRENGNAIRRMLAADTSTKVNSALYETTRKEPVDIGQKLRNFVQKTADSGMGLKKLDNAAQRAGIVLAAGADARASQARTASQAVEALFFDGMYDRSGNRVSCSLADCVTGLRSEQQMNDLNAYLEIKQALDRYEQNHDDWIFSNDICTVAEARAFAQRIESSQAEIVEAANNIWNWLKTYRDTQLSTAITEDARDAWEALNPHYIPQTRHFTSEIRSAVRGGGIGGQGTGVNRRRVGSTRDIVSPIDAIANMVARTKTAAMQHDVVKTLQEYYDLDRNGVVGEFIHEIDAQAVPHVVPADVIRRHVVNAQRNAPWSGIDPQALNNELENNLEDATVFEYTAPNGRVGNAIAITEHGTTRYFEVHDQDLLNALTHMPSPELGVVLGGTQKVGAMINSLITSKNPAFALGNAARDAQEAYFTGSEQNPIRFAWDYLGAMVDVVGNRDAVRQYRAMGGSGGLSSVYASGKNIDDLKRAMFGSAGDNRNAFKVAFDKLGDAIEVFNGGVETIPRLAEYKRQLRRGESYAAAIKAAKNCTTDFSTRGTSAKTDSALWRFFNASVQSTYKAARLFTEAKTPQARTRLAKQMVSMVTLGVAGRALAEILLQMNDDDETYAALPDYIKDGYWVIPTKDKGKYIRIPLPNGALMTTVNSLGRRIGMAAMGIGDGQGVGETLGDQASAFLMDVITGLSPFGDFNEGNPLGSNFVLNPLVQLRTNKSWTGSPIVPASMEGLSPALQYNEKTSEIAKLLGKTFNMSPLKIDYLISQNSGVLGELNDAVTAGIAKGKSDGVMAGVGGGIFEFALSRFVSDTAYSQQVTSAFYDERKKLEVAIKDVGATMDRDGIPYSPVFRNLNPKDTYDAYEEAKVRKEKMDELGKELSEIGNLATKYANEGNDDKAREMKFKQQELAAEAAIDAANFFDKWKNK